MMTVMMTIVVIITQRIKTHTSSCPIYSINDFIIIIIHFFFGVRASEAVMNSQDRHKNDE